MQKQNVKLQLIRPCVRTLIEWFLFQEQCDIRIEGSSLHINEIHLENKLSKALTELKKNKRGYILIDANEAAIAKTWYENLPEALLDESDKRIKKMLDKFFINNP